ncbi:MAG: monovalent cation/H(+) antiporter subunit G [Bacillota bacterium]
MARTIFSYYFLITGTFFLVSTAVGMIRFPDFYTRLHAGSKCLVAGGISVLIGFMIREGLSQISLKLFILSAILLITSPVAVHAIARSAYHYGAKPQKTVIDHLQEQEEENE